MDRRFSIVDKVWAILLIFDIEYMYESAEIIITNHPHFSLI
jgi:hypothetical protein